MANALSFLADPEYYSAVKNRLAEYLNNARTGKVVLTGEPLESAVKRNFSPSAAYDMALNISNPMASAGPMLAGIFAGKGAKTADALMLAKAQDMAKAGIPAPQIWKETGWALDTPDKMPRFEIPDNAAKWTGRASKNWLDDTKANEMLQHQQLSENYPDVMNLKMTAHPDDASSAFVNVGQPYINVGLKGADNPASPAIHELQHAIQQREGFARGGSPDSLRQLVAIDHMMAGKPTPTDADVYKAYQSLAGEAEARLTQARMNMTPEQRLAQYPYEPKYFQKATGNRLADLIVRMDGGTAMSVPDGNSDYIVGLADEADKAMRAYEARRVSSLMPKPESIRLRDMLIGVGAMGGGIAGGYYGMDAMAGER